MYSETIRDPYVSVCPTTGTGVLRILDESGSVYCYFTGPHKVHDTTLTSVPWYPPPCAVLTSQDGPSLSHHCRKVSTTYSILNISPLKHGPLVLPHPQDPSLPGSSRFYLNSVSGPQDSRRLPHPVCLSPETPP